MGAVWVADHLALDTKVVVKFMAKEIADNPDGVARFAREASVAAQVKSPHVVQVFDHGVTANGHAYIVMELLEGRDLAHHLTANGPMPVAEVAALVAQVAKALSKAHQVGVVHRDIKPDNIFLCDSEGGELFVKLLDFGIAKRDQAVAGSNTTTGSVVGTPYYMSPEQIVGEKDIDARTDIWSLGVVAFEAITGQRPFQGTTVGAITLAIHTGTRRITDHLPDAPVALDEWFSQACARDPKGRFQTAREASQALLVAAGAAPAASLGRVRAPMASLAGDTSDPALARSSSGARDTPSGRPSDGRAVTALSSTFPAPRPSRGRPALVAGVIGVALVLGGAVFALPALLRSPSGPSSGASNGASNAGSNAAPDDRATSPSGSGASASSAAPSAEASGSPTPGPSSSGAALASGAHSGSSAASAVPSGAAGGIVTAPHATSAGAVPGARTSARPTAAPTRTTRPRTRDDDDIK